MIRFRPNFAVLIPPLQQQKTIPKWNFQQWLLIPDFWNFISALKSPFKTMLLILDWKLLSKMWKILNEDKKRNEVLIISQFLLRNLSCSYFSRLSLFVGVGEHLVRAVDFKTRFLMWQLASLLKSKIRQLQFGLLGVILRTFHWDR